MSGRIRVNDATAEDMQMIEAMKEKGGDIGILPNPQGDGPEVATELAQRIASATSGRVVVLEALR